MSNTVTVTIAGTDIGDNFVVSNRASITTPDINCNAASSPCVATVPTGSTMWLFGTPSNTSGFPVFSGNLSSTSWGKITVNSNLAITATFDTLYDKYGGLLSVTCPASLRPTLATTTGAVASTGSQTVTVSSTSPFYATATGRSAPGATQHTVVVVNLGAADQEVITITAIGGGTITANFGQTHLTGATLSAGEFQVAKTCFSGRTQWAYVTPFNHPYFEIGAWFLNPSDTHNDNFAQDYSAAISGAVNTGTADTTTGVAALADGAGTGKYGSTWKAIWGAAQMQRWDYMGMNSTTGVAVFGDYRPIPIFIASSSALTGYSVDEHGFATAKHKHPFIPFLRPDFYSITQTASPATCADGTTGTQATCGAKNIVFGRNSSFSTINTAQMPDFYDTEYAAWLDRYISANQGDWMTAVNVLPKFTNESEWTLGVKVGQSDDFGGMGAGPDWPTSPTGKNHRHIGFTILKTAPHIAAIGVVPANMIYADSENKTKKNMASYLCGGGGALYSTVGALNTAWSNGSFTVNYTSCGTAGTQVTNENLVNSSGNTWVGATAGALAHANVDKFSIQIYDGNGLLVAGDTGAGSCLSNKSTYTSGTLVGTTCAITYTSGAFSVTFNNAITGTPKVSYWYGGWGVGNGLLDEDGRNTWMGTGTAQYMHGENGAATNWALGGGSTMIDDLDKATKYVIDFYASTIRTNVKKWMPNTLWLGEAYTGNWGAPGNKFVLQGFAPYVDVLGTDFYPMRTDAPFAATSAAAGMTSQTQFVTTFLGDKPYHFWHMPTANLGNNNSDSPQKNAPVSGEIACDSQTCVGRYMYNFTKALLTQGGVNGSIQGIGYSYWQFFDQNTTGAFFDNGIVTTRDNIKNGVENSQNAGTDTNGFAAVLESVDSTHIGNYGDRVSWMQASRSLVNRVFAGTASSVNTLTHNSRTVFS